MQKQLFLSLLLFIFNCSTYCQVQDSLIKQFSKTDYKSSPEDLDLLKQNNLHGKHAILLKGKIKNFKEKSWTLLNAGFLGNRSIKIKVQDDGSFSEIVPVEGITNLYFMLNDDAINFNVEPNKIIILNWDEKNFIGSFKIGSYDTLLNKNLNFNLYLHKKFRQNELSLEKLINENNSDDKAKFYSQINDLFNEELKELKTSEAVQSIFFFKIYYKFQALLLHAGLLKSHRLTLNDINGRLISFQSFYSSITSNSLLSSEIFYQCPEYRDFLYRYINNQELFSETMFLNAVEMRNSKGEIIEVPYTLTKFFNVQNDKNYGDILWAQYYKGLSQIPINSIRDWYVTNHLINSFKSLSFKEVEPVYEDFLQKCQTSVYKDTLISISKYYKDRSKSFKAPDFMLNNEKGKLVSLSSFEGKVVYLDFWGISCAPCLDDIKNYIPALHERYKKEEVVFINVCVDSKENKWKKALSDLKLEGVNLIAEGFTTNQICIDYNIDAIPHYMVIDKKGNLREINAPRPNDLLKLKNNVIDEVLKE